jgi:hypothetical protein
VLDYASERGVLLPYLIEMAPQEVLLEELVDLLLVATRVAECVVEGLRT